MKNISWGADFKLLNARYFSKYAVDGKEYNQTLNNFKHTNIINPNNSISIGNTCASSVTFSIYKPEISLENKEITIYEGINSVSGINYIKIGTFTITKQESDGEYTKYTGYDSMYKADKGYFSELTFPNTDKAILEEICTKLGISLATAITTTHSIEEKPQGYTMREMIGYMAMLQGSNAVINSDGNLVLKWYTDSKYTLDGHQYYQQGVTFTTSKDFTIQKLTCNNTKSGDKETSTITSGSGATGLNFANPFMTQANLDEVFNKIGGFTFRPLNVKCVGDWRIEVGDIITVNKNGKDYIVPVMQIVHECDGGLMDTITSIGQSDTENSNVAAGPVTKQMERYYADLVLLNKAIVNKLDVDDAEINYATIKDLNATNATIEELDANKLSANYADIINANVDNLKTINADITNLKADSLTAETADIRYAQIDFANVKGQVVDTSLIKDGAVTNEKVQSLSANKLTAGTIDASKITVSNLNADNLTVGTINGKLIGNSSIDLDKLSQEVPTKEYLDKVQEELQGQIDGQIETFTVSEIPTLNNSPVDSWGEQIYPSDDLYPNDDLKLTLDPKTLNKHIGDICYVVNPASSADGYSYRFANTGTIAAPVYEWVLIKDSDVTKALQDIININGEITGIESFNVEISSWKTNTDSELSSLKTRTTTLETDIGTKVSTTVFNEVKQTVDENSSNITKMSETLSKKADSSTVETISTTVNNIKQTADTNTASITSLTNTVSEKADSSTVETISTTVNNIKQTADTNTASITSLTNTVSEKADSSTVETISTTVNDISQNLDSVTVDITKIDKQVNGSFEVFTVTATPTKDNYPASNWHIPIYPSDSLYPSDTLTWTYSNEQYAKYDGSFAHNDTNNKTWRWVQDSGGNWTWQEVSNTQLAYMLNQNASFKIELGNISTSLTETQQNLKDNYSTTTTMINTISQEINDEGSSISLALSGTYAKSSDLKSYATEASLTAYIKKDPESGELKSAIETIADDITLSAKGSINIKGNKKVNISGDAFTLSSTKTDIAEDGTITCNNLIANAGKISKWGLYNNSINSTTDDGKYFAGMAVPDTNESWVFVIGSRENTSVDWEFPWYVRADGYMHASNAFISGNSQVGGWKVGGNDLYSKSLDENNYYRTIYMQVPQADSTHTADEKWIFSIQKANQQGENYTNSRGLWVAYGNGDQLVQNLTVQDSLSISKNLTVYGNFTQDIRLRNEGKILNYYAQDIRFYASNEDGYGLCFGVEYDTSHNPIGGWHLGPLRDSALDLGTSYRKWDTLYAKNGEINTSDRNKKHNINELDEDTCVAFTKKLKPTSYIMNDNTSERTHYGFIAQDVEETMNELGIDSKDFAGFIKTKVSDNEYDYALRYSEFIPIAFKSLQYCIRRIKEQQEEITKLKNSNIIRRKTNMIKCGDFSAWNGDSLDFDRMRVAGLTHAILKVIRRDFNADEQFENNWKKCQLAGIHICGVYNYVYTPSVEEAITAAKSVLNVLNGRKVKIWMDIEDTCMQNLGAELIDIIKAYKHTIEDAGYEFGIYTGMAWYGSYIAPYADEEVLNCDYWIARYYLGYDEMALDTDPNEDKKPSVARNLVGWQYTSSGVVDGVDGVCDLSVFYGEHEENSNEDYSDDDDNSTDEHVYVDYAAYTDRWWGKVTDNEDWAGAGDDKAIKAIAIRVSRGSVKYRVHLLNGGWLPYVTGCDYDDFDNGYAGDKEHAIDAIEVIYYTPDGEDYKYARYMVSPFGMRNFYPEQIDNETDNGMDGYAGEFGKAIDKFQIVVE